MRAICVVSENDPRPFLTLEFQKKCIQTDKTQLLHCVPKSDAKIQITITTAYLIRIKYPMSGFNYHLPDVNFANFNKIYRTVSEQQLFQKWNAYLERYAVVIVI